MHAQSRHGPETNVSDSVTRFVVEKTGMSNQVGTVLQKNGRGRLEQTQPLFSESD